MKIIITENQVKKLLDEAYDEHRINSFLDKINKGGYDSLTPKEKDQLLRLSKKEDVPYDDEEGTPEEETPYDDTMTPSYMNDEGTEDLCDYFFAYFPTELEKEFDGEMWSLQVDGEPPHILMTNGIFDIIGELSDGKFIFKSEGIPNLYYNKNDFPTDVTGMEQYVKNFIQGVIPKVIRKIKTQFK